MSFREQVAAAATQGLLLGVKALVVIICVGVALLLLMGDYATTRQNATFAANTLRAILAQQQQATVPLQGTPAPVPVPPPAR